MYRILFILALGVTLFLPGWLVKPFQLTLATEPDSMERTAPLFDNLGNHHHPISTDLELAQDYFDRGLILAYGFNHAEAVRSFREAARLDPSCAMCYWGIAYVLGPNINAPMAADAAPEAWQALQKAIELSDRATEKERAYIQALATRYTSEPVPDRSALDRAYAGAMRELARRYPDDLDARTLFAEALMDTTPWDYWEDNGDPKPEGVEIMATLESILERDPKHPGANHLYIHAVEKERPALGIAAADRLRELVPGAGHLVHMPSHIYIRVGRYHDAVVANQRAVAADNDYLTQCHAQGIYPLAYMPHNHHFLWYAATMAGQREVATEAARNTSDRADRELMRESGYGTLQHFYAMPLYNWVKFGKWDEILAEPSPADDLKYPTGVWHYARGMAFAAKNQPMNAAKELDRLRAIAADPELESVTIWDINTTADLLGIASEVLAGELEGKRGNYDRAIAHLKTAVELEENLNYDEPASWHSPVRQSLGAVLLEAGHPVEAEAVYRQDLAKYPDNGWSLYGLAQSLREQSKLEEAQQIQERFEEVWQYADITLSASRI